MVCIERRKVEIDNSDNFHNSDHWHLVGGKNGSEGIGMTAPRIEYSGSGGRFTREEIRANVAETKRRKAQPGYAQEVKRLAEAEMRAKRAGIKFPELAKRGTRPVVCRSVSSAIEDPSITQAKIRLSIIAKR